MPDRSSSHILARGSLADPETQRKPALAARLAG